MNTNTAFGTRQGTKLQKAQRLKTALLLVAALAATAAQAGVERDLDEKTSHRYFSWTDASVIDNYAEQGYRLFDIEVVHSDPHRYAGSMVKNTGPYQANWSWTANKSKWDFINFYTSRESMILDVEIYTVGSQRRYAGTFVENRGRSAKQWQWFENMDFQQMLAHADAYGGRIIDLDFEVVSGQRRFYGVMIKNKGADFKDWVAFSNIDSGEIKQLMSERNMRIVDIERISDDKFAGVLQTREGQPTWYFTNRTWAEVQHLQDQFGSRIIDIERSGTASNGNYNIVLINNANALEYRIGQMLRNGTDGTRGFILKEVNGPIQGELMPHFRTYPASTIKVLEHYYWSRRIGNGFNSQTNVPHYTNHTSDTHVQSDIAFNLTLQNTMQQMMRPSNNQSANALQEFAGNANGSTGRDNINAFAKDILGLNTNDIRLYHKFADGNVANDPYNIMTMRQISALYEAFANSVGLNQVGWNFFRNNMLNETGTGGNAFINGVRNVMLQEGGDLSMSNAQINAVFNQIQVCWKPGNVPNYNSSAGWIRIPFKVGENTVFKEYTVAVFQDDFTNSTLGSFSGTVMPEILRDTLANALETWK